MNSDPSAPTAVEPPLALLAELTYRCPLRCGYCSNPIDLGGAAGECSTETWIDVLRQAAALGALQCHFSGGEPLLRDDLERLVRTARSYGMYTNLITSAWALDATRFAALRDAGLEHVQISLQDVDENHADAIAGATAHCKKLVAAKMVSASSLPLSINVVLHRGNLDRIGEIIELAHELGAERIELANTQYHGWALRNRASLMPTREQFEHASQIAAQARERFKGEMQVIYVMADYFTDRPKPCMNGWGTRFMTVTPEGKALPCPGAHRLALAFDDVRARPLREIWYEGAAFQKYRGTAWMREPCASCDQRTVDHGGCRCQAFELTGDATNADPTCALSPQHSLILQARSAADQPTPAVLYRIRSLSGGSENLSEPSPVAEAP